jgi:hypothetical protein
MKIDCSQIERLWNERLDAPGGASPDLPALEAHAAHCPACREVAARYQLLGHALRGWGPPPAPPEGFADRVLAARQAAAVRRPAARLWRWAAAAAVLAASAVGLRSALRPRPDDPGPRPPVIADGRARAPRPLAASLADATLATLDLARQTSAPAARIGRRVLASTTPPAGSAPPLTFPASIGPAADALQSVGDGVNQGMRPLSGSARHAFRFLLAPALEERPPARRHRGA